MNPSSPIKHEVFDPYPNLPAQVRDYKLTSVIGRGGFGIVYKATNLHYNIEFAVKCMTTPKEKLNRTSRSFDAEVSALLKLDHPNVIRMYDFFRENDLMFLVLEYCPCGTLEDLICQNGPPRDFDKIKICSQIISALQTCHSMSIAHRDIKTSNVLFDSTGRVKVADFGLSELMEKRNDGGCTLLNEFCGSLVYSPPEIYRKVQYNPFMADIWSLGVLFYKLTTGEYPWPSTSFEDMKKSILGGVVPSLPSYYPLSRLISQMLKVNPEQRLSIDDISKLDIWNMNKMKSVTISKQIPLYLAKSNLLPKYKIPMSKSSTDPNAFRNRRISASASSTISTFNIVHETFV